MIISALSYFRVANRRTFGLIFDVDFDDRSGDAPPPKEADWRSRYQAREGRQLNVSPSRRATRRRQ
jgi:hypothetical protein